MLTITANEYLDRRLPEWETYERVGLVRYDAEARMVQVEAYPVADMLRSPVPLRRRAGYDDDRQFTETCRACRYLDCPHHAPCRCKDPGCSNHVPLRRR